MEAQPASPNPLLFLFRAEGAFVLVVPGVLLTFAAIALLIVAKRPVVYAIFGALGLLPLVIGLAGMVRGYSEYSRMATTAIAPKPAELADAVLLMASSGILGIFFGLLPLALCFVGIMIHGRGNGSRANRTSDVSQ